MFFFPALEQFAKPGAGLTFSQVCQFALTAPLHQFVGALLNPDHGVDEFRQHGVLFVDVVAHHLREFDDRFHEALVTGGRFAAGNELLQVV